MSWIEPRRLARSQGQGVSTVQAKRGQHQQLNSHLQEFVDVLIEHQIDLNFAKQALESFYIRRILQKNNGHIGRSATELGMHRNTLSKRIKELSISC